MVGFSFWKFELHGFHLVVISFLMATSGPPSAASAASGANLLAQVGLSPSLMASNFALSGSAPNSANVSSAASSSVPDLEQELIIITERVRRAKVLKIGALSTVTPTSLEASLPSWTSSSSSFRIVNLPDTANLLLWSELNMVKLFSVDFSRDLSKYTLGGEGNLTELISAGFKSFALAGSAPSRKIDALSLLFSWRNALINAGFSISSTNSSSMIVPEGYTFVLSESIVLPTDTVSMSGESKSDTTAAIAAADPFAVKLDAILRAVDANSKAIAYNREQALGKGEAGSTVRSALAANITNLTSRPSKRQCLSSLSRAANDAKYQGKLFATLFGMAPSASSLQSISLIVQCLHGRGAVDYLRHAFFEMESEAGRVDDKAKEVIAVLPTLMLVIPKSKLLALGDLSQVWDPIWLCIGTSFHTLMDLIEAFSNLAVIMSRFHNAVFGSRFEDFSKFLRANYRTFQSHGYDDSRQSHLDGCRHMLPASC